MPPKQRVPKYRLHKPSGQAVVTLNGRDIYLGKYDTERSRGEYDRVTGEWLARGRRLPQPERTHRDGLTVLEMVLRYWEHAQRYYVKDGRPSGSIPGIKVALKILRESYGHTAVAEFGPLALEALQRKMVALGQSRRYINDNTDRIRRAFKWGVSQQLVPPAVLQSLQAVSGLKKGRTTARDLPPVKPVDDATVDATIPFMPPIVADMVRFQRLTGARPGEVCILRPCDLDRSGEVWEYRPEHYKTEHHDEDGELGRVILIGPKAREILLPYLLRAADAYCFSPAESDAGRKAAMRAKRETKVQPSQVDRSTPGGSRIGARYNKDSYRRAIVRAVEKANRERIRAGKETGEKPELLPQWAPNRLRHTAGTEVRKRYGLEASQVVLGHSKADVTQIYAERDMDLARRVIAEVG